jgi:hypothetical protein
MPTLYCACDRLKKFTTAACSPHRTASPPRHAARSPLRGAAELLPSYLPCGATPVAHRAKSGRGALPAHRAWGPRWRPTLPARHTGAPPFLLATLVRRVVRPAQHVKRCAAPPVAPHPPCCPPSSSGSVADSL